ncbi:hypothetical protein [Poritiphilus flavus]|uniref:Viral A-type inclusion protein n=1 Tax=Poritiphilus flavus TaxID=2697053 RepID=A0A6L9ED99_9FLAO|nr:hypothetical protein [Poritiphilus flavus]NAS12622.1 hypothetical protein [Poritiphilus flavus]
MKLKILVLLSAILLLGGSCKQKAESEKEPSQMDQVMAIHDEVMPKMSTIGKLVKELKPRADSTEMGMKYDKAMKDLQASHKSMMDWMKGFGDRFEPAEILDGKELTEQKQLWLDEEEIKVKEMRDQINTSIANAEKLLQGQ